MWAGQQRVCRGTLGLLKGKAEGSGREGRYGTVGCGKGNMELGQGKMGCGERDIERERPGNMDLAADHKLWAEEHLCAQGNMT